VIRQPTPMSALYAWHREAVQGFDPPIHDGVPECGWFKTRLVRGGPWVAVEIKVVRDICPETGELLGPERLVAICDGDRRDPARLWTHLTPITRDEHAALILRREAIPAMAATMARLDLSREPMRP
jgi:hypothetical protein